MKIPQQLAQIGYRFCKLVGKRPIEEDWQNTRNYAYNDPSLQDWINKGNNIGVVCGYNLLMVLDFDTQEAYDEYKDKLPETFQVKSGGRGLPHLYYKIRDCDEAPNFKHGKIDIKGLGGQIVCPGSKLETGTYQVVKDLPINEISYNLIKDLFLIKDNTSKVEKKIDTSRSGQEWSELLKRIKRGQKSKEGLDKEEIMKAMNKFSKWEKSTTQYKELTWENALKKIIEEQEQPKKGVEKETKYLSSFEDEKYLYEEIFEIIPKFARYNKETKKIDYVTIIEKEDYNIEPVNGEEVTKRAILLPNEAVSYNNEEELDNNIKAFINEWLDIPEDFLQFSIWNIKRSWIFERFHTLNYLRALGDTGQGKSRFLDVLGSLHYKPIFTSGATTASPVFRIIDKWRGTMIFDEADLKETDETADIIKIINMGYEKGKFVMRCDQNDAQKILFFDPYCPKVIATRKPFTDKAVESRCITQVMTGTRRKDIRFSLTEQFFKESQKIRNQLLTWRFYNLNTIEPDLNYDIGIDNLEPRVQQIVSSYVALFGHNQEEMQKFKKFIEEYQKDLIQERADSWAGQIVKAIYELFHEQGQLNISSFDIIKQGEFTDHKGEQLKPRALTNTLKELGFGKTISKKIDGKTKRCIPLETEVLKNIFQRYGCDFETKNSGYEDTKVTIVTGTGKNDKNYDIAQKTINGYDSRAPHIYRDYRDIVTDDLVPVEMKVEDIQDFLAENDD